MAGMAGMAAGGRKGLPIVVASLVLAAAAVAHVSLHLRAGLNFPVPWPDELHFALPSRAFAHSGQLHAPALHPTRPLMWMPPGYAWLSAPVHAMSARPLIPLRALSMVAVLFSALLSARLWARAGDSGSRGWPFWACALASLWLLHPAVIAGGNVARMDAWVLCFALGGFVSLQAGRPWIAMVLLALAPLLHPNGLYFCAAALAWKFATRADTTRDAAVRPSPFELAALALVALAWLSTLSWFAAHGPATVEDMGVQFARKAARNPLSALWGHQGLRLLALLLAFGLAPATARKRLALPWAFALAAWSLARIGHEMWYEPFDAWVAAACVVLGVQAAWERGESQATGVRRFTALLVAAGLLLLVQRDAPKAPDQLSWKRMALGAKPYVDTGLSENSKPDEVSRVATALAERGLGTHADPVEFFPYGDALLFPASVHFVDRVRYPFAPHPRVLHVDPAHPRHWTRKSMAALKKAGAEGQPVERLLPVPTTQDASNDGWWLIGSFPKQTPERTIQPARR